MRKFSFFVDEINVLSLLLFVMFVPSQLSTRDLPCGGISQHQHVVTSPKQRRSGAIHRDEVMSKLTG